MGICMVTTHGAYAMSEYNKVYIKLNYTPINRKLGAPCLLTDDIKLRRRRQGFDRTEDDKIITELWKQF